MKQETITPQTFFQAWTSGNDDLRALPRHVTARMLFDILLSNEFEHALLRLKAEDCLWGPVHTSVGQEAIAAGVMAAIQPSDKVVATYRSHHQFIVKALHAVLPSPWDPLTDPFTPAGEEVILKTLGEIMGLANGYCAGRGGSMHLRSQEAGFLGSNPIVGGGIPLATGAAFAEKFRSTGNVVVCFFGDGAANIGSFHEACNLAALWKLPVIFFIENNAYAVATSTKDACSIDDLYLRAISYGMNGYSVDGNDVVGIHGLMRSLAGDIRAGGGPCLVEAKCYRRYHHAGDQPGSVFGYRSRDEEAHARENEVVTRFPRLIVDEGILSDEEVRNVQESVQAVVTRAVDACTIVNGRRSVRQELWPDTTTLDHGVKSDGREWAGVVFKEREQFGTFTPMRYVVAISAVTGRWLETDPEAIVIGEEVANFGGGAYGATKGLPKKYPGRVLNTPISEAGFVGLGLGAAMSGMRPVVEIMFPDFSLVAADQLFNQIGRVRHMYGDTTDIPLVVRTRVAIGCGYGGQHSMDPVALYALFPGWRIIAPANSFDYIGLFNTAMRSLDPVLVIEHHSLYTMEFPVPADDLDYCIPFGKARVVTEDSQVTLLTYGSLVGRCEQMVTKGEMPAELIDLRTLDLQSIDYETIGGSVRKTGRVVIAEEAALSQSIGATIAAVITERFFKHLRAPVTRVTSRDIPLPVSRVLEQAAMISDEQIRDAVARAAETSIATL